MQRQKLHRRVGHVLLLAVLKVPVFLEMCCSCPVRVAVILASARCLQPESAAGQQGYPGILLQSRGERAETIWRSSEEVEAQAE